MPAGLAVCAPPLGLGGSYTSEQRGQALPGGHGSYPFALHLVTAVCLGAPDELKTAEALEVVGPRAFGLDNVYRPCKTPACGRSRCDVEILRRSPESLQGRSVEQDEANLLDVACRLHYGSQRDGGRLLCGVAVDTG